MIIQIGLKKIANLYFVAWQTTSAVNMPRSFSRVMFKLP